MLQNFYQFIFNINKLSIDSFINYNFVNLRQKYGQKFRY
jgi:hypothetical protein